MKSIKCYFALQYYNPDILQEVMDCPYVTGVVLGDLFCQKRMFDYGEATLIPYVEKLLAAGKEVIYQLPLYLTERVFEKQLLLVAALYEQYGVRKYLVADVGMASAIRERFSKAEIIWSQMGRNRNSMLNRQYAAFLKTVGVTGLEAEFGLKLELLPKLGLTNYAVLGYRKYNTLSRECYSRYLTGNEAYDCGRICRTSKYELESPHLKMTVDGHLLGEQWDYNTMEDYKQTVLKLSNAVMIYGNTCSDCKMQWEQLQK